MSVKDIQAAFDNAETIDHGADHAPDEMDTEPPIYDLPPMDDEETAEARAAAFPLNDYGNGQRLMEYFGDDILFVPRLGWFRWEGRRWQADEDEIHVRRDAQKIGARIEHEISCIALEEWQREALELWREVKPEFENLQKVVEKTAEEASRMPVLRDIEGRGTAAAAVLKAARKDHRAHAKASGNTSKISNMLAEAKVAAATAVGALNANKLMLNTENGVVHFTQAVDDFDASWGQSAPSWRVDLLPHDRRQMISKMAAAEIDPAHIGQMILGTFDARGLCPNWLAFLETVQPDPAMSGFLQRWFGYSMTGLTTEQKLAFFFGGGRNGKSTAVDVIARILDDYGSTIPIETLTGSEQRKGSDATPDLVRLPGARFVRASEPEQGQKMKEALIKALTGGEPIMIRRMQQEFFEVVPEFKLTISGNHKPEIRGADDGIWRRVLLVPFDVQIAAEDVDPGLPEKLWAERDGILAWMVQGCLDYLQGGLREPAAILAATAEYRSESDPLGNFLKTECEITGLGSDFALARDLSEAFNCFLLANGDRPWTAGHLSRQIKMRADNVKGATGKVFSYKKRSDAGYIGIKISDAAMNRIAEHGPRLRGGQ